MKENNTTKGFSRFLANLKALFSKKNKKSNNEVATKDSVVSEINASVDVNQQCVADKREENIVIDRVASEDEIAVDATNVTSVDNSQKEVENCSQCETENTYTPSFDTKVVSGNNDTENVQNAVAGTPNDVNPAAVCEKNMDLTPQQEYVQSRNMNVTVPETTIRSFLAKLLLVSEETQNYYSELKNYVLSYVGTRCRTSWQYDSIYKTRILLARFVIRGKSLWQYVALTPDEVPEGTNCQVTDDKKYEGIEVGLKIQGQRTFKQAKNLLKLACEKVGLVYEERESVNYIPPYMSEEEMLEKGFIKKVLTSTNPKN